MSTEANTNGQDVFDDSGAGESGNADAGTTTATPGAGENADKGTQTNDSGEEGGEGNQTGEEGNASGTPPEGQPGDPEYVTDAKGQKLIPEHRFKAALKKATEEHDVTKAELAKYTAPTVPDRDTDPEGHDLHIRMEASKSVMMDLRPDYQEKIDHFAKMAESNPLLNQAVAGHPIPAKLAYDIAAKDLEIKEALALKDSDDWKEFQAQKKAKAAAATTNTDQTLQNTVANGLRSVPNLNRSTNASPNRNVRKVSNGDSDDDLFKGAL